MFGFFSSKKRAVKDISNALNNVFSTCFFGTNYWNSNTFVAPYKFWEDEYIAGFIFSTSGVFLKYQFNGDKLSQAEKGEITLKVMQEVCGSDAKSCFRIALKNTQEPEGDAFKQGADDAFILAAVALGATIKDNSENPKILEAQDLARTMHESNIENAELLGEKASSLSSFWAAYADLSVREYVKNKYLS